MNILTEKQKPVPENKKISELEGLVDELGTQLAENFYQSVQLLSSICILLERYYEGSHSRFVAEKSAEIARELNFSDTEIMEIKIAALLHDIGKIGFSDKLHAVHYSKLSQREFRRYATHGELGKQILSRHSGFDIIGEIIYQHHEKLDGSGFPRHLSGDKLHPGALIIAVVDYYHNAMYRLARDRNVSDRSSLNYSSTSAFLNATENNFVQAMNYLQQKKKRLFGVKIVDIFTELVQSERVALGMKTVVRVPVNQIDAGMVFAEDYFTAYGLLIAAKGESASMEMRKSLIKFAEANQIPHKILIIK